MSSFTRPGIIVEKISGKDDVWYLKRSIKYYIKNPDGNFIIIPKNFKTDFATIPRIFWTFFPPASGRYAKAAVVHDWLLKGNEIFIAGTESTYQPSLKQINLIFLEAMKVEKTPKLQRLLIYAGVEVARISGYIKIEE